MKVVFRAMGTSPHCNSERGKKAVRHSGSGSANSLRTRTGMLSGPDIFRAFSFRRSLVTPAAEMMRGGISGRLGSSTNGIAPPSSLVNTDWNCSEIIFDFIWLVLCGCPSFFNGEIPTVPCFWAFSEHQKVCVPLFQADDEYVIDVPGMCWLWEWGLLLMSAQNQRASFLYVQIKVTILLMYSTYSFALFVTKAISKCFYRLLSLANLLFSSPSHLPEGYTTADTLQGTTRIPSIITISVYFQVLIYSWMNQDTIVITHSPLAAVLMSQVVYVRVKCMILCLGLRRANHSAIVTR